MKKCVAVVDYGIGNILSVTRALEHCGADVDLVDSPDGIASADRVVLPGVGAFEDGMRGLNEKGLSEPLRVHAREGKPLLGICLGMQMLMEWSDEFGRHAGLGLIPGEVRAIPAAGVDGLPHKIPHIGWNALTVPSPETGWEGSLLEGLSAGEAVYFVHSFTPVPSDVSHRLADCLYNGLRISAAIRRGAVTGCQFHPEKSAAVGLRIIRNFLDADNRPF